MHLTLHEAIDLIVQFMPFLGGCWANEVEEKPLVKQFIQAGWAALDEEHGDKYLVNDAGQDILRPHIERISHKLIHFMLEHQGKCTEPEGIAWLMAEFGINDSGVAEELLDYIAHILHHYGYNSSIRHPRKGDISEPKVYYIEKAY